MFDRQMFDRVMFDRSGSTGVDIEPSAFPIRLRRTFVRTLKRIYQFRPLRVFRVKK